MSAAPRDAFHDMLVKLQESHYDLINYLQSGRQQAQQTQQSVSVSHERQLQNLMRRKQQLEKRKYELKAEFQTCKSMAVEFQSHYNELKKRVSRVQKRKRSEVDSSLPVPAERLKSQRQQSLDVSQYSSIDFRQSSPSAFSSSSPMHSSASFQQSHSPTRSAESTQQKRHHSNKDKQDHRFKVPKSVKSQQSRASISQASSTVFTISSQTRTQAQTQSQTQQQSMDLAQASPDATLIDLDDDFLFTGEQGTETLATSTSQVSTAEQALQSASSPDRESSNENLVTVDDGDDVGESPQY